MAMDFETVRGLRLIFALIFALVGAGAGIKYLPFGIAGAVAGGVIAALIGWNAVDFFKGRPEK